MNMVGMAVLDAHGDDIQGDLSGEAGENQAANQSFIWRAKVSVSVIQLGEEMKKCEAKKIGAGESVQKFDVLRLVELEKKEADPAQEDAGEQEQVIHN